MTTTLLWGAAALLVAVAGLRARAHLRDRTRRGGPRRGGPRVDDEALRRILDQGVLPGDPDREPLDLQEIEDEERRFWEDERWDEAEEW